MPARNPAEQRPVGLGRLIDLVMSWPDRPALSPDERAATLRQLVRPLVPIAARLVDEMIDQWSTELEGLLPWPDDEVPYAD